VTLPPRDWWRTVFYLIPAITLYTVVLGVASLAASLVDRRGQLAHRCAQAWSWLILKTTRVDVRLHGAPLPPPGTSCVFVSNHQSMYDIPVLFATLPFQLRIIAKASMRRFPFLGWHLHWAGHVFVDREHPGPSVLRRMRRMADQGASLIVFPEGTRSRDGQVGTFKAGVFLLAIESGLSVVPISLSGSRQVMQKGRLMTCPGVVDVTVHAPIATDGLSRADTRALASRVRGIVAGAAR
jgi:1-acyl-sn-glycerol-3-phosphate acyltransferase